MNTKNLPWEQLRDNISHKHLARDKNKNFQIDIIKIEPNTTYYPDVEWIYIGSSKL